MKKKRFCWASKKFHLPNGKEAGSVVQLYTNRPTNNERALEVRGNLHDKEISSISLQCLLCSTFGQ